MQVLFLNPLQYWYLELIMYRPYDDTMVMMVILPPARSADQRDRSRHPPHSPQLHGHTQLVLKLAAIMDAAGGHRGISMPLSWNQLVVILDSADDHHR